MVFIGIPKIQMMFCVSLLSWSKSLLKLYRKILKRLLVFLQKVSFSSKLKICTFLVPGDMWRLRNIVLVINSYTECVTVPVDPRIWKLCRKNNPSLRVHLVSEGKRCSLNLRFCYQMRFQLRYKSKLLRKRRVSHVSKVFTVV